MTTWWRRLSKCPHTHISHIIFVVTYHHHIHSHRNDLRTAKSNGTKQTNTLKLVREELATARDEPRRITKGWLEERLTQYYQKHPRCKSPAFVEVSELNALKVENRALERSLKNQVSAQEVAATVAELVEQKTKTRQALSRVTILEGDVEDKENEITEIRAEVASLKGNNKTLKTSVTELTKQLAARPMPPVSKSACVFRSFSCLFRSNDLCLQCCLS